jgi:2-desacetyl-2-hydroxyethyl bacteriochlorophyllide A dehydrogenase
MNMKAASVIRPGLLKIEEVPIPEIGPKEVLCKVSYCGICGTDMAILSGELSFVKEGLIKYPCRIGHEWSGIIEKVGDQVTKFKPGDRVVTDNGVACGECKPCMEGNYGCCENGRAVGTVNIWPGAFAEYMVMPAKHVYKLPDNIGMDEAAMFEPAMVGYTGLRTAGVGPGTDVLIIGTGPIGLSACAIARAMGASKIMISGRRDAKLDMGLKMGAQIAINTVKDDFHRKVMEATEGKGVSAIVETSGNIDVINEAIGVLKTAGTLALVGFYEAELNHVDIDKIVLGMRRIVGVAGSSNIMPHIVSMVGNRQADLRPLITSVYGFDRLLEAFDEVKQNKDTRFKVLVKIGRD